MDDILKQVKENMAKLEGCAGPHDFSIPLHRTTKERILVQTPLSTFGCKWQCSKCGGYIDPVHRLWYQRGLEHGKRV